LLFKKTISSTNFFLFYKLIKIWEDKIWIKLLSVLTKNCNFITKNIFNLAYTHMMKGRMTVTVENNFKSINENIQ